MFTNIRPRTLALGLFTVGAVALAILTGCSNAQVDRAIDVTVPAPAESVAPTTVAPTTTPAPAPAESVAPTTTALVATSAPTPTTVAPTTTVETNRCPDVAGVVTVEYGDDVDCDVSPPQRLDVRAWTDPVYGVMTPAEFADACSDMGGILEPVPTLGSESSDFWLCTDVDY